LRDFFNEAEKLKNFRHPNVVLFYGIWKSDKGEQYMVTELVSLGSMKDVFSRSKETLNLRDLIGMAKFGASGMMYLENKGVIHRDLAARNLLVTLIEKEYVVKIADFGLSMKSNQQLNSGQFPIRWTPPEGLTESKFSHKSDVYSYGIVLFEIITLGELPFPDIKTNEKVLKKVTEGYKMPKPDNCPEQLYSLMVKCWEYDPEARPNFQKVFENLTSIFVELKLDQMLPSAKSKKYEEQPILKNVNIDSPEVGRYSSMHEGKDENAYSISPNDETKSSTTPTQTLYAPFDNENKEQESAYSTTPSHSEQQQSHYSVTPRDKEKSEKQES